MPGKKGFGTIVQYRTSTGPDVWVTIANLTRIRPFNLKVDSIDVSSQDSPDEYREKIPGFKDAGECSFDLNYDDGNATHEWLETSADGTVRKFRVCFGGLVVGNKIKTFDGFIVAIGPETPHDGKMNASCTINVTSKPVTTTHA